MKQEQRTLIRELFEFDCTRFPSMEAKAIEVANRIAGPLGQRPSLPDPVQVLDDAASLLAAGLEDYCRLHNEAAGPAGGDA